MLKQTGHCYSQRGQGLNTFFLPVHDNVEIFTALQARLVQITSVAQPERSVSNLATTKSQEKNLHFLTSWQVVAEGYGSLKVILVTKRHLVLHQNCDCFSC